MNPKLPILTWTWVVIIVVGIGSAPESNKYTLSANPKGAGLKNRNVKLFGRVLFIVYYFNINFNKMLIMALPTAIPPYIFAHINF